MVKAKRVAVFEKNVIDRFIYERILKRADNTSYHFFGDLDNALAVGQTTPFDIVFVDVHFGGENCGLEILPHIKKVCSGNLVSIAVTSFIQRNDFEKIMAAGFNLCIEKPLLEENIFTIGLEKTN